LINVILAIVKHSTHLNYKYDYLILKLGLSCFWNKKKNNILNGFLKGHF